jgi:RNA polymerase sigma-70 factor, ECF subfamily
VDTLKYSGDVSTSQSDYELAQAVSHGTVSCLADLYERHNRKVFALCLRMTGDVWDAEDLTQEIFIQLLRKVGTFRGEGQFTTWLYRLTTNQVLMHMRRPLHRRESASMLDDLADTCIVKHSFGRQLADRITLKAALRKLPSGYRSVFLKYDVEGYNHNEIAEFFGCSVGNSKSQLHKARRKLRKLLKVNRSQSLRTPIKRTGATP